MQQAATAEVRLDKHKAASFGPAGPSILPFWLSTKPAALAVNEAGCDRISLLRDTSGTEDRDQQLRYPGNVG